jgi:hypothetical protein
MVKADTVDERHDLKHPQPRQERWCGSILASRSLGLVAYLRRRGKGIGAG